MQEDDEFKRKVSILRYLLLERKSDAAVVI